MGAEKKGLARAKEIYDNRSSRATELRKEGKKIIGYQCIYPVIEMLTAADMVPYRIFGDIREPITKADSSLPTVVCPFLRSTLDIGLKGQYDFLDGMVMAHACEVAEKLSHIWKTYINPEYSFFIDTPHTTHKAAQEHHRDLLEDFKKSLEAYTGKKLTDEVLNAAIELHNEQRKLVRELYELRKPDPPRITGTETLQVIKALMSIPVEEGNQLIREVIDEVGRREELSRKNARLFLWGSIVDDTAFVELIEDVGAHLVMDDTCVGSRAYFPTVEVTDDPLGSLAYTYLVEIKCPRTFRESEYGEITKNYQKDLKSRFDYIYDYIRDWNADGVILFSLRYCDIHGYEVPGLRDYFGEKGIQTIYLEPDYSESALAPLRTRIEAFIETLR